VDDEQREASPGRGEQSGQTRQVETRRRRRALPSQTQRLLDEAPALEPDADLGNVGGTEDLVAVEVQGRGGDVEDDEQRARGDDKPLNVGLVVVHALTVQAHQAARVLGPDKLSSRNLGHGAPRREREQTDQNGEGEMSEHPALVLMLFCQGFAITEACFSVWAAWR
jgi:hypothetical protein